VISPWLWFKQTLFVANPCNCFFILFDASMNGVRAGGALFSHANLKDISMEESVLTHCRFDLAFMMGAVVIGSKLMDSSFHQVVLRGAALEDADFSRVDLSGRLLNEISLKATLFRGALHIGTRFVNGRIDGADFSGAVDTPKDLPK